METLRVGRGYTASWAIQLRYASGAPIEDVYAGTEPLDLVVCDLEGAAETLVDSSVEWLDAAAGTLTLTLDNSDTELMEAGPRGLSIGVTTGGERREAYRATLRVEPRPI